MNSELKKLQKKFKQKMNKDWGTYNKICKNCLCRKGHNLIWCPECGKEMINFLPIFKDSKITNREWIRRGTTPANRYQRLGSLCVSTIKGTPGDLLLDLINEDN